MLLYLFILVGLVLLYRIYNEGFSNPFSNMDTTCLYVSNIESPVKNVKDGISDYTNVNNFLNNSYSSILKKADMNVYYSSNKPPYCRI